MKEQINSKTVRVFGWGRGIFSTHSISYVKGSTVHSFLQAWLYSLTGGHRFVMSERAPLFKVRNELALEQKNCLKMSLLDLSFLMLYCLLVQSQFIATATCINI